MESVRQKKIGKLIQQELGEIFQKEARGIFGPTLVTVTQVRMTPDLSLARVYLSFLPSDKAKDNIKMLTDSGGRIRGDLGNRLKKSLRRIPELEYFHDDTGEYASRINKILDELDIPPEDDDSKKKD